MTGFADDPAVRNLKRTVAAGGLMVGAIVFYGYAAFEVVRGKSPGPRWAPIPWAVAAACAAGLVLLSLRRRLFQAAAAAGVLFAGLVIADSRTGAAALAAAVILAAAFGVGDRIHAALARRAAPPLAERLSIGVALGIAALALAIFALGSVFALGTGAAAAVVAGAAAIGVLGFFRPPWPAADVPSPRRKRGNVRRARKAGFFPQAILGAAALLQLAWAVAPEYRFDAMNYHLSAPRDWLRAGGVVPLPYWHSTLAHLAESFLVLPLAIGGPQAVTLAVFGVTLATAAAAWALAEKLFGAAAAPWGAALFAAAPIIGDIGSHVYADPVATLLVSATVLAILPILAGEATPGRGALLGFLAGAAVATKINAALALLVPGAVVVFAARRRKGVAAAAAGAAAIVAAPWFWQTWRFTGNPVFPFLNGWFRSPLAATTNGIVNATQYGIARSPASWPRLFVALTLETQRFGENLRPATLGVAYLLLPILLLGLATLDRRHAAVAATVLVYAVAWSLTFQHARYLTMAFPLIAALAAGTVAAPSTSRGPSLARIAVGATLLVELLLFAGRMPEPWRLDAGKETPREYLERAIPTIDCVLELDRAAGPDTRIASIGGESVRYYVSSPLDIPLESPAFARRLWGRSGDDLRNALWAAGDRFLLLTAAGNPQRRWTGMEDPAFLRTYTAPVCGISWLHAARLLPPGESESRADAPSP